MTERYFIDTSTMLPITPPGFASPKDQISYTNEEFQDIVIESFGTLFPRIVTSDRSIYYELMDERKKTELISISTPAKSIQDIPKSEVMRLLEGWIRLRRYAQEPMLPSQLRALILNFKVPDPDKSIDSYRLVSLRGKVSLHVLWGFQSALNHSVTLEQALSKLLEVPSDQLISLMASSVKPNMTSSVPIPTYTTVQQLAESARMAKHKGRIPIAVASAAAVLAIGMVLVVMTRNDRGPKTEEAGSPQIAGSGNTTGSRPTNPAGEEPTHKTPSLRESLIPSPSSLSNSGQAATDSSSSLLDQMADPSTTVQSRTGSLLDEMVEDPAKSGDTRTVIATQPEDSLLNQLK